MVVRDAQVGDLPGVFAIYNEHVLHGTATFETEPYEAGRDDGWLTGRDLSRHPVLVAEEDGAVAGWASLTSGRRARPTRARPRRRCTWTPPTRAGESGAG